MGKSANNSKVINDSIKLFYAQHQTAMIELMKRAGDMAMDKCLQHPYMNRTNNLEDSLGYGVYVKGNNVAMIWANSPRKSIAPNGTNRSYDSSYYGELHTGRDVSELFLSGYKSTANYELVVVAGQWYASFVENVHNLDVITNSFAEVRDGIPNIFKDISNKVFIKK